jgi:hypothetical protein
MANKIIKFAPYDRRTLARSARFLRRLHFLVMRFTNNFCKIQQHW